MDLGAQVQAALSGQPTALGPNFLQSFGFPDRTTGDQLESANWTYRDTVRIPLTALSDITLDTQLFTKDLQGQARNLKFPLTADLAFVHGYTLSYADFTFDPTLDVNTNALFGPMVATTVTRFLQATILKGQVSQKNYMDESIHGWTNYQVPLILQGLTGQSTNAPFQINPPSYGEHHRVNLPISPVITWPASSTVSLTLQNQMKTWWNQVISGTSETTPVDYTIAPWNIKIAVTLKLDFVGVQIRKVK